MNPGRDPLIDRKKTGRFLEENLLSLKTLVYPKSAPIRQRLGDWNHVAFLNLFSHSIHMISPNFVRIVYNMGKFIGYFTAKEAFSKNPSVFSSTLIKELGGSWRILEDKRSKDILRDGWIEAGGGIVDVLEVDSEHRSVVFSIKETASVVLSNIHKPLCHFELGILCGQMEYLLGGKWYGVEKECVAKGDKSCVMELVQDADLTYSLLPQISREEAESILEQYTKIIISPEKDLKRPHVSNMSHIALIQAFVYVILSISPHYSTLLKYAGRVVGKKIAALKGLSSPKIVFKYLKQLFMDLRLGFLEVNEQEDRFEVILKESVFSSGVKNTGMKLCTYFAGIIEGCLDNATGKHWCVEEKRCTANNDPVCSFICISQKEAVTEALMLK